MKQDIFTLSAAGLVSIIGVFIGVAPDWTPETAPSPLP